MSATPELLATLLDNVWHPYVFCDTDHVIRYMNRPAREKFAGRPAEIGRSIFDCHNDESNRLIVEITERFMAGGDEELITDNAQFKVWMHPVRDADGTLLGYYERYERPEDPR